MVCIKLNPTEEVINYVKKFNTDEELLRSGGLPIEILDKYAFGFSENDIKTIDPSKIKIKWKNDYENVIYEINNSGLKPIDWAKKINLGEPIDLSYEDLGKGLNFYLEDGHHRYVAAKLRKQPLNVNLEIKYNPINKITNKKLSYDEFHRCLFKEVKNMKSFIKQKLREQMIDDVNMNKGTETICDKLTIGSYSEALHYVEQAMKGVNDATRQKLMQKLHVPLENIKQQQTYIGAQKKSEHMTGDSMPDEADTYWTEIQTILCDSGPDFE